MFLDEAAPARPTTAVDDTVSCSLGGVLAYLFFGNFHATKFNATTRPSERPLNYQSDYCDLPIPAGRVGWDGGRDEQSPLVAIKPCPPPFAVTKDRLMMGEASPTSILSDAMPWPMG